MCKFFSALGHICSEITWKGILKMLNGQIVQHFSQLSIFSLSSLKEITLYLPNIGWFKSVKGLSVQNKQNIWTLFSPDNAEVENLIKDIWEMVIWLNLRLNFLQNSPNTLFGQEWHSKRTQISKWRANIFNASRLLLSFWDDKLKILKFQKRWHHLKFWDTQKCCWHISASRVAGRRWKREKALSVFQKKK